MSHDRERLHPYVTISSLWDCGPAIQITSDAPTAYSTPPMAVTSWSGASWLCFSSCDQPKLSTPSRAYRAGSQLAARGSSACRSHASSSLLDMLERKTRYRPQPYSRQSSPRRRALRQTPSFRGGASGSRSRKTGYAPLGGGGRTRLHAQ